MAEKKIITPFFLGIVILIILVATILSKLVK